jgi:hypothetical protein
MKLMALRRAFALALFLPLASSVFAFDFGGLLETAMEAESSYFWLTPGLTPWFSWDNGEGMSAYLSAMVSARYENYYDNGNDGFRKPALLPELTRFSFAYNRGGLYSAQAGRVEYTDVLAQTACGLFDGLRFQAAAGGMNISAGAFYTGLVYKETARILMTGNDAVNYAKQVDGFSSYHASKRLFAFGRVDMPLMDYHNLFFEVLAQFDLNGGNEKLHSQYAQFLVEIFNKMDMRILGGAVYELMENRGGSRGDAVGSAFGALASVEAGLPGPLNDSAKLTAKFSSGPYNGGFGYMPLTSAAQGMVYTGVFSGLWLARLDYEVRLLPSLYGEANASLFAKTYKEPDSPGSFYGGEMWASLAWRPYEDLQVSLGGGLFIPGKGYAHSGGRSAVYRISAGVTVSF